MAAQKTEAVLITDKRSATPPLLNVEKENVAWSKSVRYLGVQIDGGLKYTEHVTIIAEKAATTATAPALKRLKPIIGGPSEMKKKLQQYCTLQNALWGRSMGECHGEGIYEAEVDSGTKT